MLVGIQSQKGKTQLTSKPEKKKTAVVSFDYCADNRAAIDTNHYQECQEDNTNGGSHLVYFLRCGYHPPQTDDLSGYSTLLRSFEPHKASEARTAQSRIRLLEVKSSPDGGRVDGSVQDAPAARMPKNAIGKWRLGSPYMVIYWPCAPRQLWPQPTRFAAFFIPPRVYPG